MLTAKDIMSREVVTVTPETTVNQVARTLFEKKISGVPVVDESGKLLGVVTESDLIDQKKKFHIPTVIAILDSVIFLESAKKIEKEINKMTGAKVKDICTLQPISVTEGTPVEEIATIMAEKKVHTLPVLRDGQLVGVVGKTDIIKTLAGGA